MSCVDCHNPHGTTNPRLLKTFAANEPGCFRCHSDKRGPFTFEHAPMRFEGCQACHEPHGSAKQLAAHRLGFGQRVLRHRQSHTRILRKAFQQRVLDAHPYTRLCGDPSRLHGCPLPTSLFCYQAARRRPSQAGDHWLPYRHTPFRALGKLTPAVYATVKATRTRNHIATQSGDVDPVAIAPTTVSRCRKHGPAAGRAGCLGEVPRPLDVAGGSPAGIRVAGSP